VCALLTYLQPKPTNVRSIGTDLPRSSTALVNSLLSIAACTALVYVQQQPPRITTYSEYFNVKISTHINERYKGKKEHTISHLHTDSPNAQCLPYLSWHKNSN